MNAAYILDRIHFAFTVSFHYLFPQMTMGLAPLIVLLHSIGLRRNDDRYRQAARFWARIFALNFVLGVVTGIPMEFQFGTNWAQFSRLTGGVIAQPLVMEGVFSFFLESTFVGLYLFGEKRLGPRLHWWSGVAVFIGSWLSGFFIVMADAWMQHPVAYARLPDGSFQVTSFWGVLANRWGWLQYAHTMSGAVITASIVMAGTGAFYLLNGRWRELNGGAQEYGRMFVRVGVIAGVISSLVQIFPTGDLQGKYVARHQPTAMAATEGVFYTERGAPLVLIGQPDPQHMTIENPLAINDLLSFLAYGTVRAEVKGLDAFPRDQWPGNIPLVFFSYHIMAGLGTLFALLMLFCAWRLRRGKIYNSGLALWLLLLATPFPFIANTAGWVSAETARQPWIVYGLLRTSAGYSYNVSSGSTWFTLLGYMGMYAVLGLAFVFLLQRIIVLGPEPLRERVPTAVGISG